MELTPAQRIITFAIVVLLLAGLGVYMFLPRSGGNAAAGTSGAHSTSRATPVTTPSSSPSPQTSTSSPPSGPGREPDIYSWLPFTQSELGVAAQVTVKFADDYGTYSYQQSTNSYLAPMKALITGQLAELIGRAYATPGLAATRTSTRQVSAGSGVITSLRAFGSSSLTFVVSLTQKITSSKGTSNENNEYAVTVTGSGSSWQVSNIELAAVGNS